MYRFSITIALALAAVLAASLLVAAPAAATGVSPAQLREHGWTCFVPAPFPDTIVCGKPGLGLPPVPPDPEGRPSYNFLVFDLEGAFRGTVHMIRADLYQGQPCPQTGGAYFFNPVIGYYRCEVSR